MLIVSLWLTLGLLLTVNLTAYQAERSFAKVLGFSAGFALLPMLAIIFSIPVVVQAILIAIAAVIWRMSQRGPAFFLALSCGATLIAYAITGLLVLKAEHSYANLRTRYPFESMEVRVPVPRIAAQGRPLALSALDRLNRLENRIHPEGFREYELKSLHENIVGLFINSPGFGMSRMGAHSNLRILYREPRSDQVPVNPGSRLNSQWSPGLLDPVPFLDDTSLPTMLDDSIVDFVNGRGFGYVKDRRHVAGFEPHQFSQIPDPSSRWKVQSIELVSLLLHDKPMVYVSDRLPAMNRSHDLPTRPLNEFEEFGLHALRNGDDLFSSQEIGGVRLLGAIRNTKQCIVCHGGSRGDLLGAFSYTLSLDPSPLSLLRDSP